MSWLLFVWEGEVLTVVVVVLVTSVVGTLVGPPGVEVSERMGAMVAAICLLYIWVK